MRKLLITILILFQFYQGIAQLFPVDTLIKNGPLHERVNLVFLGDGYTIDQQDKFILDVNKFIEVLFSESPFKQYKYYFNVFAVKVPSNESGASHAQLYADWNINCANEPALVVDNYFGSKFDNAGLHHLLLPDNIPLMKVLAESFPNYSQAFLIVNSPYYGGSGGHFPTASSDSPFGESVLVFMHEIGHSFGGLADEYGAGNPFEQPNLTQENNPLLVKWKNWLGTNGIGIFEIPGYVGWYRPHQSCKMKDIGSPYCSVCIETIVEKIHSIVPVVTKVDPVPGMLELTGSDIDFALDVNYPQPNTIGVTWKINNKIIHKNVSAITIPDLLLNDGYQKVIRAEVIDTTFLTRSNLHPELHLKVFEWVIDGLVTKVETELIRDKYEIGIWPNPFKGKINVSMVLSTTANVIIETIDIIGRKTKLFESSSHMQLIQGNHLFEFELNGGIRILSININGENYSTRVIGIN